MTVPLLKGDCIIGEFSVNFRRILGENSPILSFYIGYCHSLYLIFVFLVLSVIHHLFLDFSLPSILKFGFGGGKDLKHDKQLESLLIAEGLANI